MPSDEVTPGGGGFPLSTEARGVLEAARREGRGLTDTERAIAQVEAFTAADAEEMTRRNEAPVEDPGTRKPMVINLGPQHPSTHGVLRLITQLDGETVIDVHPVIGYLHTGIEKQCENKTYWQAITLVTRMDYLSPYFNTLAYCMAVEKLLDLEVPERAEYIRVIMCELNRITSHLVWLGTSGLELGAISVFFYTYRERDEALDLGEMISGERMNTRYFHVGGCAADMPEGFEDAMRRFIKKMPGRIDEYETLLSRNQIWVDRTKGVGILPVDDLIGLGVTGPALRAAGVSHDLRKAHPYCSYEHFDFDVPTATEGDVYARYTVRLQGDARVGADHRTGARRDALRQPHRRRSQGRAPPARRARRLHGSAHPPLQTRDRGVHRPRRRGLRKPSKAPAANSRCYLVSDGGPKPYRCHMRDPSFVNLQALRPMAKGSYLADMIAMIGSMDNVMGGVDR